MTQGEYYPEALTPIRQTSWADLPASKDMRGIPQLELDPNTTLFVQREGFLGKAVVGDGVRKLASEGFGKCAPVLLRGKPAGNGSEAWYLAHARQLDEALNETIKRCPDQIDEALIVFGSVSANQGETEEALDSRGARIRHLFAETGGAHFHVVFDLPSKELTVVRKTPDQSLLTYRPYA